MSPIVLRLNNVRIGRFPVSLEIRAGERWAIYGPDGAGKSTLLRIMVGHAKPREGQVERWEEDRPTRISSGSVGYLPQVFAQYEDLTVEETLRFFGALHGLQGNLLAQRMRDLLQRTGLEAFPHRRVAHLSGGMRKKLALITQLLHHPSLLILDEPTLGVDPLSRAEIWSFLYTFRRTHALTLVYATVYADEAERADRVLVLHPDRPPFQVDPRILDERCVVYLPPESPPEEQGALVEQREGAWGWLVPRDLADTLAGTLLERRPATLDDWLLAQEEGKS